MKHLYEEPKLVDPEIIGNVLTNSPTGDNDEDFPTDWGDLDG